MRTRILLLSACLVSCSSAPTPKTVPPTIAAASAIPLTPPTSTSEYAGVYISSADEDRFTPCGMDSTGDTWTLRFRDNEIQAPFLKTVTAARGRTPLTHFIRVRGTLGPPGSYNGGFQTRELAVDSVLDVKESLEPCVGFGSPAAWSRMPARFRDLRGVAMSSDRRFAALMDTDAQITVWSTETGKLVRRLGPVAKGYLYAASYGPMTFSDDATLLAVGAVNGTVHVWRLRDGRKLFSLALKDSADVARERAKTPPRKDEVGIQPLPPNSMAATQQVVFNRLRTLLATTNSFSSIVWSMKTGKKLAEFDVGNDLRRKVFFVGDEGLLMTADNAGMVLRSDLDATPVTRRGTRAPGTQHVAMSPDGRMLAVHDWSDSVFLWSLADGPGRVLRVPPYGGAVMAFSPDGNTIAISGGEAAIYLFDTRTGAPIRAFYNFPNAIYDAWFTTDGKAIIALSHFADRFRIAYIDPAARPAGQDIFDDSLTAQLPLGPPPSNAPRTVGGTVMGSNRRAVAGAEVAISNGIAPDSVVARTTTSYGGYFSFTGIRFGHMLVRVRKPGFVPGISYLHANRWRNDDGPWSIELKAETDPGKSAGDKSR